MKTAAMNLISALLTVSLAFLSGCGGGTGIKPAAVMDTGAHHLTNGMSLLEKGDLDGAEREFTRAVELEPKSAGAHAGLALVAAGRNEFDKAFAKAGQARKLAVTDKEKADAFVLAIRLHTLQQDKKWLAKAHTAFQKACACDPQNPAPHYYMGRAYRAAGMHDEAAARFAAAVAMGGRYRASADREWEALQRTERAIPGSYQGQRIAQLPEISRADFAALLNQELALGELFGISANTAQEKQSPALTDYDRHELHQDIATVVKLNIRGFEQVPEGIFRPDDPVDRTTFAIAVEDILSRTLKDPGLETRMIGSRSPFSDVPVEHYAFNAIMVCTSRGIMSGDLNGTFNMQQPVSGADALLMLRNVKEQLNR